MAPSLTLPTVVAMVSAAPLIAASVLSAGFSRLGEVHRSLGAIHEAGAQAGVALDPATSLIRWNT